MDVQRQTSQAVGTNYLLAVVAVEVVDPLSGTSASTPTVAGMVSVINDMLINDGKAPVGFINPVLYENANNIGVDILTGNNKQGCPSGFSAVPGWDAITGVGSPLFDKLKSRFWYLATFHKRCLAGQWEYKYFQGFYNAVILITLSALTVWKHLHCV